MAPKDPLKAKDSKDEKASPRTGERASRPGAVSVSASQQAELLDQRIAQKSRAASASAEAVSVGASVESVRGVATPGGRQEMHASESASHANMASNSVPSDAAAKQSARASAAVCSRPGAYATTSLPSQTDATLYGLGVDAQAKQRALVGAFAESLDAKIATKMTCEVSQRPKQTVHNGHSVDADASSKSMARAYQTASAQPGAYASSGSTFADGAKKQTAGLNELESAIAAKLDRWEAGVSQSAQAQPGAYAAFGTTLVNGKQQTAALNELESAIAAKLSR
jgi:hypothetical protein